jgi:hypothetical protein
MRAIASFAMRSPTAASVSAAVYAVFALFFAPFMVVSGAVIGLATLRSGWSQGLRVTITAALIGLVAYYALLNQPDAALLVSLSWLPILAVTQYLRSTERQGTTLTGCALFATAYALCMRMWFTDVEAQWLARLQELGEAVTKQGGTFFGDTEVAVIAGVMHEAPIVVCCLYWMTATLLARWWQSELYNPGGFGAEFRCLVIPRYVSPVAAVAAGLALMQSISGDIGGVAGDLLIVLVVLFAFQGLALIHDRMYRLKLSKGWLVGLYTLLTIMPHRVGLILAFAGIADTIIDARKLRQR